MLKHRTIFIAEDEPFISLDIAFAIEDANGQVIGPASSVAEALMLLQTERVDGAILDVNLTDRDVTPVVAFLVERGVPIILQSGVGLPSELTSRFPDLTVHIKPCSSAKLVDELVAMLDGCKARLI